MNTPTLPREPLFPEWAALRVGILSILIDIHAHRDWDPHDPRTTEQLPDDLLGQLDSNDVLNTLSCQLSTSLLDELHDNLWLIARRESSHIDSLHYHVVKGRSIVTNEESKMHLLWTSDKIHPKPIPQYLLSYHFWEFFLCPQTKDANRWRAVADRFLRSYAHLVRDRSDLSIAHEKKLIPEDVDWPAWTFALPMFDKSYVEVAKRYHYWQMRLSWLSHLVRLHVTREWDIIWFYEPPYLRSLTTSLAFLLTSVSLILSSMQVSLNVGPRTSATSTFSRFSTFMLVIVDMVWLLLSVVRCAFLIWQFCFALRQRNK